MLVNSQAVFNICENIIWEINFEELVDIVLDMPQNDKDKIRQRLAAVYMLSMML